jgi:WD40 repeat protein
MPALFSSGDGIVSHASMLYSSASRQLLMSSTASTMHLLSLSGDSSEIVGRHSTNGSITCLSVPSGGRAARLHQHVFVGSSNGSAGMIELIDIDASAARPILSLNRGLVTQPLSGSVGGVSALASLPSNPFLLAAGLTDGTSIASRTRVVFTCHAHEICTTSVVACGGPYILVNVLFFAGSVGAFDVRSGSGAGSSAMQLRVACERIGAAAFVNVGGGSDAVIAASDDGCVTMFDSRRTDLPLSIVEVSHGAAAVQSVLCVLM